MRRFAWLAIPLLVAGCGGGKPSNAVSVSCPNGVQLNGAASVDVLGDPVNGHPTLEFPDPVNPGKIGTITVPTHQRCKITPTAPS